MPKAKSNNNKQQKPSFCSVIYLTKSFKPFNWFQFRRAVLIIQIDLLIFSQMIRLLFRHTLRFAKITPQVYPQVKLQFQKSPSLKSLGEYFSNQNTEELFDLIIKSKITPLQSNSALESLLELCETESDQQLNLIVNVLKQKAINNTRMGNVLATISEFQQAISTILLMENPDELALSQIYKFIGDSYVQLGEMKKAEKSLRDSQNLLLNLKQVNPQDQKYVHSGLACIYTQLCMIYYRQKKPIDAYQILRKSLSQWEKVSTKFLQQYELTCRLKCMLHILFRQNSQAVETAKHFLTFQSQSPQYIKSNSKKKFFFSKLYYLNIICNFQQQASNEEKQLIQILKGFKAERGQQKLKELMAMVGIKAERYQIQ